MIFPLASLNIHKLILSKLVIWQQFWKFLIHGGGEVVWTLYKLLPVDGGMWLGGWLAILGRVAFPYILFYLVGGRRPAPPHAPASTVSNYQVLRKLVNMDVMLCVVCWHVSSCRGVFKLLMFSWMCFQSFWWLFEPLMLWTPYNSLKDRNDMENLSPLTARHKCSPDSFHAKAIKH